MTHYGIPYMLEDKTGKLSGSDYVDLHDRMYLSLRCTAREPTHTAYMIYNLTNQSGDLVTPDVTLDFGPGHSLGTILFASGTPVSMSEYLVRFSAIGSSNARKFKASDGQEYRWNWHITTGQEWTCIDYSGSIVAFYTLKLPGEPEYPSSSGCMLTIDEAVPHLAVEFLASLIIMRHISAHNL